MYNVTSVPLSFTTQRHLFYRRNGNGFSKSVATQESDNEYWNDCITEVLVRNQQVHVEDNADRVADLYGFAYGTLADGQPKPHTDFFKFKDGFIHENFYERQAAGEIMVSNYTRCELRVRSNPGLLASPISKSTGSLGLVALIDHFDLIVVPSGRDSYFVFPNGMAYRARNDTGTVAVYERTLHADPIWKFVATPSLDGLAAHLMGLKPDPKGLVTNVLSKANRSSLDLLTAFAEAPEAIKSILAGIKQIARLLHDVKKGQFLVKNKFGAKKRNLNLKFNQDMKRLQQGLSDPKISSARKRMLTKQVNTMNAQHSRSLASIADEFASALADVWLNYRYNIMPNVYVIQDTIEALERYETQYITSRGFTINTSSFTIPGFEPFEVDTKTACVIKRNFSSEQARAARNVISNDIFVTAWELVPLSFVIDWFINIGDMLSSRTYNPSWAQEGSTLSYKTKLSTLVLETTSPNEDYIIPPSVEITGFSYVRQVINPTSLCGLVWKPTVGLARQADALALTWRPVRSLLINLKGRKT